VLKITSMKKIVNFVKESIEELKTNVDWSSYNSLFNSSVVVLVASLVFAIIIGIVDFVFKSGVSVLYTGSF
jgi:preprotein translocase subunit SecE